MFVKGGHFGDTSALSMQKLTPNYPTLTRLNIHGGDLILVAHPRPAIHCLTGSHCDPSNAHSERGPFRLIGYRNTTLCASTSIRGFSRPLVHTAIIAIALAHGSSWKCNLPLRTLTRRLVPDAEKQHVRSAAFCLSAKVTRKTTRPPCHHSIIDTVSAPSVQRRWVIPSDVCHHIQSIHAGQWRLVSEVNIEGLLFIYLIA